MIWAFILFAPICAAYIFWECNIIKNNAVRVILKDFVDISPAVILLAFNRPWAAIFLMACLMANMFIYDNLVLGGILFAAAYASASVLASWFHPFDITCAAMSVGFVVASLVPIILLYKGEKKFKVGICVYALIAVVPLAYALSKTLNFGFLCLALGDIGLGGYEATNKKVVKIIANILYFAGTCLVPLSL
ncbi:MAG: hypothetical protein J6V90_08390 [Treponema sp.]|nr:hypothetical protein [Treponema sp.]